MSLTPANQRERADVIKRVGQYGGAMGTAAAKYIQKIERQCRRSRLQAQRCYVFENTLNCDAVEDWYYKLDEDVQNSWNELKTRFLKLQQPAEYHQELQERWESRDQLRDESPEAYALKLDNLINQMDSKFRPSTYLQCF